VNTEKHSCYKVKVN